MKIIYIQYNIEHNLEETTCCFLNKTCLKLALAAQSQNRTFQASKIKKISVTLVASEIKWVKIGFCLFCEDRGACEKSLDSGLVG